MMSRSGGSTRCAQVKCEMGQAYQVAELAVETIEELSEIRSISGAVLPAEALAAVGGYELPPASPEYAALLAGTRLHVTS